MQTGSSETEKAGPAPPFPRTIANLQIVRALAAIAVIVFHAISTTGNYGFRLDPLLVFLKGWGFQGVDLFFVISGFVMVLTQARKRRGRMAFLRDRIVRIVPTYWLLTLAVFILTLVAPFAFRTLSADPVQFIRSMTFTCFLASHPGTMPLVFVGWTLEYEMLFYLAFAASLGFSGWPKRILFSLTALTALALTGTVQSIIVEFLFGELCALHYLSGRTIRRSGLLLALGLAGLAAPLLFKSAFAHAGADLRFLLYGIPSMLVILAAVHGRQIANRLLLLIGDASYSVYLLQAVTISIFCKLFVRLAPQAPAVMVALVAILGTVLLGILFYAAVERPMIRKIRHWIVPASA